MATLDTSLDDPYVREDEQARITERLEMVELELRTLLAEKKKLVKQKADLMHDLLTGNVRVKAGQKTA